MKIEDYRKFYAEASTKASDVSRQLAFAGIAVVWLFAEGKEAARSVPPELVWPSLFLVLTLATDFFQYAVKSTIWGAYSRELERDGHKEDEDLPLHSSLLVWPVDVLFHAKLAFLFVAYCMLLVFLVRRLHVF